MKNFLQILKSPDKVFIIGFTLLTILTFLTGGDKEKCVAFLEQFPDKK